MTTRVKTWLLGVLVAVQTVLFAVLLGYDDQTQYRQAEWLLWAAVPLWVGAVALLATLPALSRLRSRKALLVVLGVGAAFQIAAVCSPPSTSTDDYRYMWDAKVQLAGVDPYSYAPSSPVLAHLRDRSIFGAPDHCSSPFAGGCTSINRPTVHTIYPPVAQAAFDVVRVASFGGRGNHLPLQIVGALGSLAIGWLLIRAGRPPWQAALWTWCPVTVIEYGNNAHIDWLAVLLVVAAFTLVPARSVRRAGALVGAAIAVKLYPVLVLPSLMRRSWLAGVAAAGVVAAVYVPHVIAVGTQVIGYLPGYLHEEHYGNGGRLILLNRVVGHPADVVIGSGVVLAIALWAWLRGPQDAARSAVVVVGVTFLTFTPNYSWYAGLLLALIALTGALRWLPLVIAPSAAYLVHSGHQLAIYVVALLAVLAISAGTSARSRRPETR